MLAASILDARVAKALGRERYSRRFLSCILAAEADLRSPAGWPGSSFGRPIASIHPTLLQLENPSSEEEAVEVEEPASRLFFPGIVEVIFRGARRGPGSAFINFNHGQSTQQVSESKPICVQNMGPLAFLEPPKGLFFCQAPEKIITR